MATSIAGRIKLPSLPPARRAIITEASILAGLALVSFLVRWPYLQSAPLFTDESTETLRSLSMAHGNAFYLTNWVSYLGALHNYIMAGILFLFGHGWQVPRMYVLVVGSLTPPLAYVLARAYLGRWQSVMAAALLATSAWHVTVDSHIAWGSSTTPFFATATMAVFAWSLRRRYGPGLALAGFLMALTMQTHPSSIALGPAMALLLVLPGNRGWLRTPWPYLAIVGFVAGYANVIAFDLTGGPGASGNSIEVVGTKYQLFAGGISPRSILEALYHGFQAIVSLPVGSTRGMETATGEITGAGLVYFAFLAWGLISLARRGKWLPGIIVIVSFILASALMAASPRVPPLVRYFTFMLPAIFLAFPVALEDLTGLLRRARLPRIAGALVGLALVAYPLWPVHQYYSESLASGHTNQRVIALAQDLERWHAQYPQGDIVIHDRLEGSTTRGAAYTLAGVLDYLLTMEGVPHRVEHLTGRVVARASQEAQAPLVVVARPGLISSLPKPVRTRVLENANPLTKWGPDTGTPVQVLLVDRASAAQNDATESRPPSLSSQPPADTITPAMYRPVP